MNIKNPRLKLVLQAVKLRVEIFELSYVQLRAKYLRVGVFKNLEIESYTIATVRIFVLIV